MSIARTETPATGLNGRSIPFQDAQPRDLPPPAARCARRPMRWRGHRPRRSCGRCRSSAPAPVRRAWAARPPRTRLPPPASLPGADRGRRRSPPPNAARGTVSPSVRVTSSRCGPTCPYSPKCVEGVFSEVRNPLATPSNSKDTPFGCCAKPDNLAMVPLNSGQRPRTASRRRWVPRGRGKPVVQPAAARSRRRLRP